MGKLYQFEMPSEHGAGVRFNLRALWRRIEYQADTGDYKMRGELELIGLTPDQAQNRLQMLSDCVEAMFFDDGILAMPAPHTDKMARLVRDSLTCAFERPIDQFSSVISFNSEVKHLSVKLPL